MSFVYFLLQPFGLPKVGARTLAIPATTVKKLKVDISRKTYSIAEKNKARLANKQYFILVIGQI